MGAPGATWDCPEVGNWVPAADAFYVAGPSLRGGMGAAEPVHFAEEADATALAGASGGRVLRLDDVRDEEVLSPVAIAEEVASPEHAAGGDTDYRARLEALGSGGEG